MLLSHFKASVESMPIQGELRYTTNNSGCQSLAYIWPHISEIFITHYLGIIIRHCLPKK